jgi:type IV conjugative transfer system coupling protein TraD
MSIFRNDTLGSWTRGGQAIVHNVRMTTQVFFQTVMAGLVIWMTGIIWYILEALTAYERYVLRKIAEATMRGNMPGDAPLLFATPQGQTYWTSGDALIGSGVAHKALSALEHHAIWGALVSGGVTLVMLLIAWFTFTRTGRGLGSNEYLRGARLAKQNDLRRQLFWQRKGPLRVGKVRIPAAFEAEHILVSGAPGTGKTNILNEMLSGIRAQSKRAIVYDTAGTFVERFYRPGKDIILNPLDMRSHAWTPWADVPRDYHYDQMAESTIPEQGKDPFWARAARGTMVAVMRKLVTERRMLVSVMLDVLVRSDLKSLAAFVAGTNGAAFVSLEGERTSAGIQAELASMLRSFAYLDDTQTGLSIRDWVRDEKDDSWLFITVKTDQLPTLRPLITVWLDIAISAIMSMAPDRKRRLYCVIDELPSLHKLPSLGDFLARARKYGGCGILGFQSYPQLEATYGAQEAAAITGYCSTWVALRANDRGTARLISENLGQVEQVEANEGMSYGVNDMRDGVNLSRVQVTRPLVMPTEVMNLPNLTGYLRFGRDLPVIRFRDRYLKADSIQPGFVERHAPPVRLNGQVEGAVGTSDEATPPDDRTGTKVDELAGHGDMPSAPNPEPDRRQSDEARRTLPLIGVSIHTVSRPDGPSRPATPA